MFQHTVLVANASQFLPSTLSYAVIDFSCCCHQLPSLCFDRVFCAKYQRLRRVIARTRLTSKRLYATQTGMVGTAGRQAARGACVYCRDKKVPSSSSTRTGTRAYR
jgi:hypothetical protein